MFNWKKAIAEHVRLELTPPIAKLIEDSLRQDPANKLSSKGSLVITTGTFTGRASDDKYVVVDPFSSDVIDWKNNVRQLEKKTFDQIKSEIIENFNNTCKALYVMEKSVSADPLFALGLTVITPSAPHAMFCQNIFREKSPSTPLGHFSVYHDPSFQVSPEKHKTRSTAMIAINFSSQEIIIAGTGYCGEIKKSIFSVMNVLLPEKKVLPMHAGANQDRNFKTSIFFGLSGTGKTTLSTDSDVKLIGDDEHGLSENGVFNLEGGCYAKTFALKAEKEPEIFQVSNQFRSLLENVVLDPETREPDYDNNSITENGRATYSLKELNNTVTEGLGPLPTNIFFLSADALGVLPPISRLTPEQAMFYYLSGYTAKLAGTEIGLKGIKTTFSRCFGAPFMMRRSRDYGNLLKEFLTNHPIDVWLVNTGWGGGPYGEGQRYPLSFTRKCIKAIQQGLAKDVTYKNDNIFSLAIPQSLGDVDKTMLNPELMWKDQEQYKKIALDLKKQFEENFKTL